MAEKSHHHPTRPFSFYGLEQVPQDRGTMMSLRPVFQYLGQAMGLALGGVALFFFSYQVVRVALEL